MKRDSEFLHASSTWGDIEHMEMKQNKTSVLMQWTARCAYLRKKVPRWL